MKAILCPLALLLMTAPLAAQDLPTNQVALQAAVASAREAYEAASNDLAKGGVRPARGKAICAAVPKPEVEDWIGTVYDLTTNGDGWGVLSVEIEGEIWLSTWNNSLSDIGADSLINPSSDLFGALAQLQEGQKVKFSGKFLSDSAKGDCYSEKSMTMDGSISEPEFVFIFSKVAPIQ